MCWWPRGAEGSASRSAPPLPPQGAILGFGCGHRRRSERAPSQQRAVFAPFAGPSLTCVGPGLRTDDSLGLGSAVGSAPGTFCGRSTGGSRERGQKPGSGGRSEFRSEIRAQRWAKVGPSHSGARLTAPEGRSEPLLARCASGRLGRRWDSLEQLVLAARGPKHWPLRILTLVVDARPGPLAVLSMGLRRGQEQPEVARDRGEVPIDASQTNGQVSRRPHNILCGNRFVTYFVRLELHHPHAEREFGLRHMDGLTHFRHARHRWVCLGGSSLQDIDEGDRPCPASCSIKRICGCERVSAPEFGRHSFFSASILFSEPNSRVLTRSAESRREQ